MRANHVTSANVGKDSLKQNRYDWRQMVWVPDKGSGTSSMNFPGVANPFYVR